MPKLSYCLWLRHFVLHMTFFWIFFFKIFALTEEYHIEKTVGVCLYTQVHF